MSARKGLPESFRSRHDRHYVETLSEPQPESVGLNLPLGQVRPNENQPRGNVGDLSGLKESIREKGVLEPLVVRREGDHYLIISGERRYRASVELGLERIPCVLRESDDQDTLEVALIENIQRKDLTPFEEADGLRQLVERFGMNHEEVAKKIGKSRTSVSESLSLSHIPQDIRALCTNHGIMSKSMLLQIARQETHAEMLSLANEIIERGLRRNEARQVRSTKSADRPKAFTFRSKAEDGSYTLTLKFKRSEVERNELIEALKRAISKLEAGH